ncbi:hypothetical protein GCK72_018035 [Caenorhabditis remanei]|uniref:SXP/RAL-2 family protein Ani s 5-like cation-binding domain-containing protein n=1 Tax=Caenorhabditis remanei TaxID=31234 RepID=A0A6A5G9P5_CAERE|nr:hypothetical protein GCK72_018035 [Caenorhabditis remanei]KAF1751481.1 hypothetical protein GCK72_018035 [Caenorhabditis remanei]
MCKLFIAVACIAAVVYAGHTPTAEEAKAEMIAAGISETAAAGIITIAEKYKSQFEQAKSDHEAGKSAFQAFHSEVETYIQTQSAADQAAYKAFVEKKKAQHQGRHSTPSA